MEDRTLEVQLSTINTVSVGNDMNTSHYFGNFGMES